MKICFLVSGGGGNLKFFDLSSKKGAFRDGVELKVIAYEECGAIDYCKNNNIDHSIIHYSRSDNAALKNELESFKPDIIITTWAKIIDQEIVENYQGKMINLHYSLLPLYKGMIGIEPIQAALEDGMKFAGATCHHVNKDVDSGRIISQFMTPTNVDEKTLINNIFRGGCFILMNSVAELRGANIFAQKAKEPEKKSAFQPNLKFDDTMYDEQFWEKLANA